CTSTRCGADCGSAGPAAAVLSRGVAGNRRIGSCAGRNGAEGVYRRVSGPFGLRVAGGGARVAGQCVGEARGLAGGRGAMPGGLAVGALPEALQEGFRPRAEGTAEAKLVRQGYARELGRAADADGRVLVGTIEGSRHSFLFGRLP